MTYILTGATGALGSQLLLELLSQPMPDQIVILARKKKTDTPNQRILKLLKHELFTKVVGLAEKISRVKVLDMEEEINASNLNLNPSSTYFIHCAASVNLSVNEKDKESLFATNLNMTTSLFNIFKNYISKFVYISTAYCAGDVGGVIPNEYHQELQPIYRNNYEASKHKTEQFLLEQKDHVPVQIFRPVVLGGSMENLPKYHIAGYYGFYLIGKFFNKIRRSQEHVRILLNKKTGLNILPVDYTAKVILKGITTAISELNIAHPKSTNLASGIDSILRATGFTNYSLVDSEEYPNGITYNNSIEAFFYKTVYPALQPYLTSKPYEYDTSLLSELQAIPEYNLQDYLYASTKEAIARNFQM